MILLVGSACWNQSTRNDQPPTEVANEKNGAAGASKDAGADSDRSDEESTGKFSDIEELEESEVLPVGDSPVYGDPNAPVTIVEFPGTDLAILQRLMEVVDAYDGRVRLVSKHLFVHPNAADADSEEMRMSRVLEALQRQDDQVYWIARGVLATHRVEFDERSPEELGAELADEHGLDVAQYEKDLEAPETTEAIKQDAQLAMDLGVTTRTSVVINGEINGTQTLAMHPLIDAVERQIALLDQLSDDGVPQEELYARAVEQNLEEDGTLNDRGGWYFKPQDWSLPGVHSIEVGDNDPVSGPDDALVTVVHAARFEGCGRCQQSHVAVRNAVDEKEGIRRVFKHAPRSLQGESRSVARAAAAAHRQDRFWQWHDAAYSDYELHMDPSRSLSPSKLAAEVDLDVEKFERDRSSESAAQMVESSIQDVRDTGLNVAPTVFINGIAVVEPDVGLLDELVDEQLKIARKMRQEKSLDGDKLYEAMVEYNREHIEEIWTSEDGS